MVWSGSAVRMWHIMTLVNYSICFTILLSWALMENLLSYLWCPRNFLNGQSLNLFCLKWYRFSSPFYHSKDPIRLNLLVTQTGLLEAFGFRKAWGITWNPPQSPSWADHMQITPKWRIHSATDLFPYLLEYSSHFTEFRLIWQLWSGRSCGSLPHACMIWFWMLTRPDFNRSEGPQGDSRISGSSPI